MKKEYLALTYIIPEEIQEIANSVFYELDFIGIETNSNKVTINFFANNDDTNLSNDLLLKLKNIDERIKLDSSEVFIERNWNEEWEKSLKPVEISEKLVILPFDSENSNYNQEFKIFINPKMSFGTGYHATTRMISSLMIDSVNKEETWIDAGTGTGILAILASKLGASEVYAFDNDEWSVVNTKENIESNDVNNVKLSLSDIGEYIFPASDGIVANLFSNVIIESLPLFYESLLANRGTLICTGILIKDKDAVINAALEVGFELSDTMTEDEWIAIKFKVKS